MKRTLPIAAVLGLLSAVLAAAQTRPPIVAEAAGMKLTLVVAGDRVEATVEAPVTGWVAVGFNPSSRMKDADYKIGYVKDGAAFARDDYGNGLVSHAEDTRLGGTSDLISFSGTESDGRTVMTFVFPVNSGDSKDSVLGPGRHKVLLAASNADNFTGIHRMRGSVDITIP